MIKKSSYKYDASIQLTLSIELLQKAGLIYSEHKIIWNAKFLKLLKKIKKYDIYIHMENEYKIVEFVELSEESIAELNTWQDIEARSDQDGIARFVGDADTMLGDYLKYISTEMQISTNIVLCGGSIVGFVAYSINGNTAHIEIVGTSPKHRKQGYGISILKTLRSKLREQGIGKITLKVRRDNVAGISAFSKIAKRNEKFNSENYFGYEL